ncbi:cobalt-precorrin-5B (C(1))-methyltransferase [filamentous cyanobacterium LEGE 11480]|uniref:Cobalt-precorrin-5B C(1)-methyltransferase n=1 Tax=Romeriopsis navalis LEGE 11480 TaxID=2777977 RepID=A0A928VM32_9CYAN|nr:cobalt-precorrin-5B (C(1))-methyltransferase CbiD [Romeriopsis navalis]MBE9030218.1 cobalt-precorrin-5B (C(1))-methyltransferase [Romeriopsis navalis LEGE 11480]
MARTGYTLPVFAVAAAKAALRHLQNPDHQPTVELDLLPEAATIPIQQVANLTPDCALGMTRSDPGDNLDLTRNTPIWARVELQSNPRDDKPQLTLQAGDGLGRSLTGEPAIYHYAKQLFDANILPFIPAGQCAIVSIILPQGKQLAERTSNAAFGIVEGLSLLGTSGISQPFSAEAHLAELRQTLKTKAAQSKHLVFCIGSNGLRVADRLHIPKKNIVQTGNWVGAMLVEAGLQGIESALVLGYQGKLIKLAGGIFNTSSHLADAKLEIISAAIVRQGGDLATAQAILQSPTADAAYQLLLAQNQAKPIFTDLAQKIRQKATQYVQKYADVELPIDTVLFDRQGQIIAGTLTNFEQTGFKQWQL